jgi:membrane-associated HD superfamily phosphohydrolase
MEGKIQKIVKGVKMYDTVQEGIEEALEKQDAIDKIQTTKQRAIKHLEDKKTTEAGKKEIQKKIEKEYKRKFLDTQQAKDLVEQKLQDEGRSRKPLGVVETEELRKVVAATMPPKELSEEARQQLIIDYIDEVMQLSEFWTGKMEKPDEKPQKEEIELLERRKCQGIMGYLIRNKATGKKFFVADLQNLNKNVADKLPAAIKINFKLYNVS